MSAIDNHLRNMSVLAGHPVTKYEYMMSMDDVARAYMQSKQDLNYALRKEVKRDRFVANTQGLQKHITETIAKILCSISDDISDYIAKDAENKISNMITGLNNGKTRVISNNKKVSLNKLASMIGKALGSSLVKLFDDVISDRDRNNKRRV